MSSRADYLKKYTSGGKKDKKKKKRKREKASAAASGMRLVESDDEWAAPAPGGAGFDAEADDEAPQVVFDDAEGAVKPEEVVRTRGAWAAVGGGGGGGSDSDASPPRRGRAGSDSDASPPRRGRAGSDSDASPPRRGRAGSDSDASPPRRGRAGSDSDASPPRRGRAGSDSDASPPRRGRAGSDSDASPPRRGRAGSDSDASPPRRGRADSDASPPRRRARADSDASPPRRPPKTERVAFAPSDKKASQRGARKMADGHSAGVLSGAEFKAAETKLREERRREAAAMDPSESGAHAATVYRDRRTGKAINLADEAARIEAEREKKAQEAREQFEWGRGTKQKEAEASAREELKAVANEPFARRADDPKLEKMRRDVIRDGDPMADYIRQSRAQEEEKATPSESRRPVYKGPPPPPNRFGIRPGYRWDGVDRGNGWEQKLQNHAAQQVGLRNDRYAWSCADM